MTAVRGAARIRLVIWADRHNATCSKAIPTHNGSQCSSSIDTTQIDVVPVETTKACQCWYASRPCLSLESSQLDSVICKSARVRKTSLTPIQYAAQIRSPPLCLASLPANLQLHRRYLQTKKLRDKIERRPLPLLNHDGTLLTRNEKMTRDPCMSNGACHVSCILQLRGDYNWVGINLGLL